MRAATRPVQRPADARLLVLPADGRLHEMPRSRFVERLLPGDLVVANDAATLPASLPGCRERDGAPLEVRLAGLDTIGPEALQEPVAVLFGEGDHRTPTEHRPPPPEVQPGELLRLGGGAPPLWATVQARLGHPRLLRLRLHGTPDVVWSGLARHGRPVQYTHLADPLALWDVWTPVAALPVAFEPPSAGFALDWAAVQAMRERGVGFATLTHAAGLSSTGDEALDARLPLDEPYRIPPATARAVARTRARGGRVVAVGTTVTRALEHAARIDGRVRAGDGLATQRLGPATRLRVVDVLLSGTHEPGTSHHALLQAFVDPVTLERADRALEDGDFRTHEFGDSVWIERARDGATGVPELGHATCMRGVSPFPLETP